jgi:hypothetical protein
MPPIMPITEIVKMIHSEGVTGRVRAAYDLLPDLEKSALTATVRQDYPQAADELAGPLPVAETPYQSEAVQEEAAKQLQGKLPDDFPGVAELAANEPSITTYAQVRKELKSYHSYGRHDPR